MNMCDKEEYNIENYYFKSSDDKKLSRRQILLILLLHGLFLIGFPITLISMINNIWVEFVLFIVWWSTLEYTSTWLQNNIINKIIKCLGIIN